MAVGNTDIYLSNGQKLSIYNSASVINDPLRVSMTGQAGSASPFDFFVSSRCSIVDIITTATAGELEFKRNGVRTGKRLRLDAGLAYSVDRTKQHIPAYTFLPGVKYSVFPTVQTS